MLDALFYFKVFYDLLPLMQKNPFLNSCKRPLYFKFYMFLQLLLQLEPLFGPKKRGGQGRSCPLPLISLPPDLPIPRQDFLPVLAEGFRFPVKLRRQAFLNLAKGNVKVIQAPGLDNVFPLL